MQSLWGEEFVIPTNDDKSKVEEIINKINNPESLDKEEFKKLIKKKSLTLLDRLNLLNEYVKKLLHEHIKDTLVIRSKEQLKEYFDNIIKDGVWAYDTETTNSLDPYTGKVLGLCLYSPSQQPAYVPIWHVDPLTDELLPNQVNDEDCKEQLQRIVDNKIYTIMHNGKFDYKFTKLSIGVALPLDWDTMIGSRIIDENEQTANLKWQYKQHVDPNHPEYDIEELFPVPYKYVDPNIFALYSATDAIMTYKLFLYQKGILYQDDQKNALKLFLDVEMPLIIPVAEMELDGIKFDTGYGDRLLTKYTKILEDYDKELSDELSKYKDTINTWRLSAEALEKPKVYASKKVKDFKNYPYSDAKGHYKLGKSKNEVLEDPINTESPQQLAILLYDILKYEPALEDKPRSTDKFAMEIFDEERHSNLCRIIRERKSIVTLLNDFIKKLPTLVNPVTHKIHCNLNQTGKEDNGVVTGRFSSSEPNLQQIPSKNTEVRLLFCGDKIEKEIEPINNTYSFSNISEVQTIDGWKYAIDLTPKDVLLDVYGNGVSIISVNIDNDVKVITHSNEKIKSKIEYVLCGSDYSGQEPRLTAFYSQDNTMIQAYKDNKDLYAVIAQSMFDNEYSDNLEFFPEGTHIEIDGKEVVCGYKTHKNKAGTKRRKEAKTCLLGILYGRGAYSIAEQVGKPKEEGQKIIDNFFKSFPKVKDWINLTHDKVKKLEYVEDWYGRRRHLPDVSLPRYSLDYTDEYKESHNTFNPIICCKDKIDNSLIIKYNELLKDVRGRKQLQSIVSKALSEGVSIISNDDKIAKAERQSVNAIVQGGAATLTKLAMVNIYNDKELNELGLRMLVPIHDELLCTCPKINGERASQRLVEVMVDTAKPFINVPMSCDPYLVTNWYFDEQSVQVQNDFDHLQETMPKEEAFEKLKEIHCELLEEDIIKMLENK